MLLLTLYGGRLADRYDKRQLLAVANLAAGALALVLSLLVFAHEIRLWQVYALALGLGIVNAVEVPTRLSFVGELVGPELLPNASALSAAYFSVARVVGPALAGVLVTAVGTGWVMLANALSYPLTVLALRLMRPEEIRRAPRGQARPRVSDGLRYVAGRPDLVLPLALVAVVGLVGLNFQLTLPLLAKTVFHADAAAFGLLSSAFAAGSLLAALAGTGRRHRPSGRLVIGSALAFGALESLAGWAPSFGVAMGLLVLVGFAAIHFAQAANHRVQLGGDPHYRGRVMALYTLILQGSTPLGSLLVGWLSGHWGARSGLVLGGLGSVLAAACALPAERRLRRAGRPAVAAAVAVDQARVRT